MTAESSRLDSLVNSHPLPTWRPPAWIIIALLAGALLWANFASLDEVAIATGEVIPQGKVRVVQHLEGGIVEKLFVTEGSVVERGAPLVQLDLATSGLNREELQARIDGLMLTRARLEAEASGEQPTFPPGQAERRPQVVKAERKAFDARMSELQSSLMVLQEQVKQRMLEVEELEARHRAVEKNLKLARERFRMSTSLLSEGLTAKMEHLQLEAEVQSLDGELEGLIRAIPKARAAVAEARERVREETIRFRREAQEQLGQIEQNISRVQELLDQANEQGQRALIRSPIDGVVKNLGYHTIGGVVRPGDPIMEVVPTGEKLVVEARLSPIDRGYVRVGQPATVKISTYDFVRYGGLEGEVTLISADSNTDQQGNPYFRVVVETGRAYLGETKEDLPITPGMQAVVDIHTGQKSVLDYLIKPVLKLRHEAFRER